MKSFLLSLLLLAGAAPVRAQVYVGPGGTNTVGSGHGTPTNPYATIQFGLDNVAAGQAVVLLPNPAAYRLPAPLTITRPLTLQGQGRVVIDGASLPAPTAGTYRCLLRISGAAGVTVQNLTFRNCIDSGARGIWITGGARNVTVQHCTIENVGWRDNDLTTLPTSVATSASAIKVEGDGSQPLTGIKLLSDSVRNCATGFGEAITITGNVDQFVVDHNVVSRIANVGIVAAGNYADYPNVPVALNRARNGVISYNQVSQCMSGRRAAPGIYLDGALNCTVVGNVCTHNGIGISVGSEATVPPGGKFSRGHRLWSNLVTANVFGGMVLGSGEAATASARSVHRLAVINNTSWGNGTGEAVNNIRQLVNLADGKVTPLPDDNKPNDAQEVFLQALDTVRFQNNILVTRLGRPALVGGYYYTVRTFSANYNCYHSAANAYLFQIGSDSFNGNTVRQGYGSVALFNAGTYLDTASVGLAGNPGLVNPAWGNFALLSASPLVNQGQLTGTPGGALAFDCGGNPRVAGSRIDLGAYESQAALPVRDPVAPTGWAYPNPATGHLWLTGPAPGRVVLRNSLGVVVRTYAAPTTLVDVSGLPPGLYLLESQPPQGPPLTQRVELR